MSAQLNAPAPFERPTILWMAVQLNRSSQARWIGITSARVELAPWMPVKPRIMYIESKAEGLTGPARIGRVSFSKTGRTLYYRGDEFRSLKGSGFKENYYKVGTG